MENKLQVLVIDDDVDIGVMIRMILEFKGYIVLVLESAEKAESVLRQNNIGVILMDMLLSGANGIDVCTIFKNDPTLAQVPLIMMSAHPDARTICIEAGADDFISKPFDIDDLYAKVEHFIPLAPDTEK